MLTKIILTLFGGATAGVLSKLYLDNKEPNFLRNIRVKKTEWIIHKLYLEKEINLKKTEDDDEKIFDDFDYYFSVNDKIKEIEINIMKIYTFTKFIVNQSQFANEAQKDISNICKNTLKNLDELEENIDNLDISFYNITLKSYINLIEKIAYSLYLHDSDLEKLNNLYKKSIDCLNKIGEKNQ